MIEWIERNLRLLGPALFVISALVFVASILLVPWVISRLPADFFTRPRGSTWRWKGRHPVVALVLRLFKNVAGLTFVAVGVILLFLPGQGVLTVLVGVFLLDIPKKRELELWVLRRSAVRKAVGWIRERAGRPPLELPPERPRLGRSDSHEEV